MSAPASARQGHRLSSASGRTRSAAGARTTGPRAAIRGRASTSTGPRAPPRRRCPRFPLCRRFPRNRRFRRNPSFRRSREVLPPEPVAPPVPVFPPRSLALPPEPVALPVPQFRLGSAVPRRCSSRFRLTPAPARRRSAAGCRGPAVIAIAVRSSRRPRCSFPPRKPYTVRFRGSTSNRETRSPTRFPILLLADFSCPQRSSSLRRTPPDLFSRRGDNQDARQVRREDPSGSSARDALSHRRRNHDRRVCDAKVAGFIAGSSTSGVRSMPQMTA